MAAGFRPFTKLLLTQIRLDEAKPGWMKSAFGLERDQDDLDNHVRAEREKRFVELDRFFGLTSNSPDIWEMRAQALIAREFGVEADDKDWWAVLTRRLANRFVPGFRIKERRGRPTSRDNERLARVFADVEFLKKNRGWRSGKIFENLRTKSGYDRRWGRYSAETLRKDYSDAKKRRADLRFELLLCGENAVFTADSDRILAAIEKHALKI
jgi:hypothetical protein